MPMHFHFETYPPNFWVIGNIHAGLNTMKTPRPSSNDREATFDNGLILVREFYERRGLENIEEHLSDSRRRTRHMAVFTNVESVHRIIYAILIRFNEGWKNNTVNPVYTIGLRRHLQILRNPKAFPGPIGKSGSGNRQGIKRLVSTQPASVESWCVSCRNCPHIPQRICRCGTRGGLRHRSCSG